VRPRKTDRHLPPCVYHRHGAYWLVKRGKWERLGAELSDALAAYGKRLAPAPVGAMPTLIDTALAALRPRLKASTAKQYNDAARKLKGILAEFSPADVQQRHVAQIKLAMAETPGMANRCLSVLRQVFDYAVEQQLVDSNPVVGVKRLAEHKRTRLLIEDEFRRIYHAAGPRLQVIMDLLYVTGQRVGDVLSIRVSQISDVGIEFVQQKTGAKLLVSAPELAGIVERAKSLRGNVRALTLLHNRRGKAPDYSTVKIQWDQARKAAGVGDATLRDIRAMSLTAAKRQGLDATALAGHTSPAMTARYLRDKQTPIVSGPSFGQVLNVGQKQVT
jgi:integrase